MTLEECQRRRYFTAFKELTVWSFSFKCFIIKDCLLHYHTNFIQKIIKTSLRACFHAGGGPQVGEITRVREGNPPVHIISHKDLNLITFA